MRSIALIAVSSCVAIATLPGPVLAASFGSHELAIDPQVDRVGDVDRVAPPPAIVLGDTVWIADWSFDDGGTCSDAGWVKYDGRILNDGSNYWSINPDYAGTGGIVDHAAVLSKHDLAWFFDGYGNNWDYSIVLQYRGTGSTLAFSFLADTEPTHDFVQVEADSAGASESRVDYSVDPSGTPSKFRQVLFSVSGLQNMTVGPIALPDFGTPSTTHQVYIRFVSDFASSPEDGWNFQGFPSPPAWPLVVDNIAVTGVIAYSEDFESPLNANVSFVNTAPATPFGEWARLFQHITDNAKCTENTTCAWLFTDPARPAYFPDMAFGPGGTVVRNWLDDVIVSPWASLASTPNAMGTILSYRRFPGNDFNRGRIVQNWSVRTKVRIDNTDTSAPGDSIVAVTPWGHNFNWNSLTNFAWITSIADMSSYVDPGALEIQVRFRHSDWQYIFNAAPPATLNPGPGPYLDRVRIGRYALTGPVLLAGVDMSTQAQDCFPTYQNSIIPGEHFSPTTDIFGSCAFSRAGELAISSSPNMIIGDSISMSVHDARGAGGIAAVRWYGAITHGPHTGKSPAPYTVGGNGFFEVTPDSARGSAGIAIQDYWFVDLDDTYFRGGDVLLYFWSATDAVGGRASFPEGITAANFPPASPEAAELATGGLLEVSFLPDIDWSSSYLTRIAADSHGDLDPTPTEIAESTQRTCILYYAAGFASGLGRRSGETHRTSFMYTLDRLGYRGSYDVYDNTGFRNPQLGGRATVAQCSGYALIIHDAGRARYTIPAGDEPELGKVDQCQWYRDYLSQGLTGSAGIANLWLLGENSAFDNWINPLIATDFGLTSVVENQGLAANPDVVGQASFTFSNGNTVDWSLDHFVLQGACSSSSNFPDADYDGAASAGTAVVTHRYAAGAATGTGAVIMNKATTLHWNTVWMGFGWFDIRDPEGGGPSSTGALDTRLARTMLDALLPVGCAQDENPTGVPDEDIQVVPAVTVLHPNVPNPFNPTTTIRFDLARSGHVLLRIFDVAGRLVTTLVDGEMTAGFGKSVLWNGLDVSGGGTPSGVYFSQLVTEDMTATRKMVLLR